MVYKKVSPVGDVYLWGSIADISSADQEYWPSPISGRIVKVRSVIHGAITAADADLTTKINGTAVTGGLITVAQSGSAAGDTDEATPTAANRVEPGDAIEVETDGASTNAVKVGILVVIRP